MTLGTNTKFRNGWQRLKNSGAMVDRVRSRLKFSAAARAMRRGLADLLFPPSCAYCAIELDGAATAGCGVWLCDGCLELMEVFPEPMCVRCGAPVPGSPLYHDQTATSDAPTRVGCYRCSGRKLWFEETIALGAYDGTLRDIVLRMKNVEGD